MEEEIKFEGNAISFNFNIKEFPYKIDKNKKVKVEFDLQFILDYLHKKKVIVFEGNVQKDFGDVYGVELDPIIYYYVSTTLNENQFEPTEKQSILDVFKLLLQKDLIEATK